MKVWAKVQKKFVRRFASDPEYIRDIRDIEAIEMIDYQERFPCHSPSEALSHVCELVPDEIAIRYLPNGLLKDNSLCWTYSEYLAEVIRAANLFHSLGVRQNHSVALLLPNVPQMLFSLWGSQIVAVATPINPFLDVNQIASISDQANATILVTLGPDGEAGQELYQKALKVRSASQSIQTIVVISEIGLSSQGSCVDPVPKEQDGILDWSFGMTSQPSEKLAFKRNINPTDIAAFFHTGGTTGTPKLAQHTHYGEMVNIGQMSMLGPDPGKDEVVKSRMRVLCGLPLFHVNAVCVSALNCIVNGGELILAGPQGFRNKSMMADFWGLVERYGVTMFAAVPTIYASLLEQPSDSYDLSSLINCGCGAAPAPASLLNEFRSRTGVDIGEGYGMTETTAGAVGHYYYGERLVGSVGLRVPYHQLRIVIIDGEGQIVRECDTNEIGVLLHAGPNVTPGYKLPENNEGAWPEPGWFNSGDLARFDEDGNLWLAGRAKDTIIRGGHNIDPLITEDALASHPSVEIAAAVGKPDAYSGELPVAYVKLVEGSGVSEGELLKYARENVSERAAAPVEIIIRSQIAVTAVGKIFKPELRKDAISLGYMQAANNACPDIQFKVWVEEDKLAGKKVLLKILTPVSHDKDSTLQKLEAVLNRLPYAWEMIL